MRTSETAFRHVAGWLPGTALALALILTGCGNPGSPFGEDDAQTDGSQTDGSQTGGGSDGENGPDDDSGGTDDSGGSDGPDDDGSGGNGQVEYEWGLPASDTSVGEQHQGAEGSAYIALSSSCAEGAEFVSPDYAPTYNFESPRNVLLFAAGVRLCEGDIDSARELSGHAEALGTAGLTPDDWAFCVLHKVVQSVLEQRPPEDFQCGEGTAPPFREGESETGETFIDDPLTLHVDESVPPEPVPGPDGETDPDPDGSPEGDQGTEGEEGTEGEQDTEGEQGTEGEDGENDGADTDGGGGGDIVPDTETQSVS
ncbi:hypothetical protein ACFFGH_10060 [Lysobacter korlensis]|uniref:Uncharacterized protein n=1 Tax=Lysobacter korlensis TaxID=553636 RepID=A0ABV6RMH8_9GAMM